MKRKCEMNAERSEAWNAYFLVIKNLQASRELNELTRQKQELLEVESLLQSDLKTHPSLPQEDC